MDISTPAGRLIAVLRQELKRKGLHFRDVATRLKISERTVKRYFSGKGVTLDVLQDLADVVELDVFSLVMLAQQQGMALPELTRAQQAALKRNRAALGVFFFLNFGMSPAQIAAEFGLTKIDSILAKLEAFGLIRRFSRSGVKILARPKFGDKIEGEGHLTGEKIVSTRRFLAEIDLRDPSCEWQYYTPRLSHASTLRLEHLIRRFVNDVAALSRSEIDLPSGETQWYRLFVGAEPIARKKLFRQA